MNNVAPRRRRWHASSGSTVAPKRAEDGERYVVRLSEAAGRRGAFSLALPNGKAAIPVDALERVKVEDENPLARPFGLASYRF